VAASSNTWVTNHITISEQKAEKSAALYQSRLFSAIIQSVFHTIAMRDIKIINPIIHCSISIWRYQLSGKKSHSDAAKPINPVLTPI
jgi:hypothetical protein